MSNCQESQKSVLKLSQTNLDIEDPGLKDVFEDIQGNILKSHGRAYSKHVFLKLGDDIHRNRKFLNALAPKITSAYTQHQTSIDHKENGKEHIFTGFLLSHTAYKALGVDAKYIPDDKAFVAGMKDTEFQYDTGPKGVHARTKNPLNDTIESWETTFQNNIDLLIIYSYGSSQTNAVIADNTLCDEVKKLKELLAGTGEILGVENGYVLKNKNDTTIEHFGFADGVSNPVYFKSDMERLQEVDKYNPTGSFGLVATEDPGGVFAERSYGSYFVYRKLQQNIKGFKEQAKQFSDLLSKATNSKVSEEFAAALAIGRHKNGAPLDENITSDTGEIPNNFNFANDTHGFKCPFQSHIRKTNPRGDTAVRNGVPIFNERSKRITRRGISYGDKNLTPDKEWTDAGLLFLSCQSDIEQQFLVTQTGWSDNPNFPIKGIGTDPITSGQNTTIDNQSKQWKIKIGDKLIESEFGFQDLIKVRGGEYFFAPSLSFFKNLLNKK